MRIVTGQSLCYALTHEVGLQLSDNGFGSSVWQIRKLNETTVIIVIVNVTVVLYCVLLVQSQLTLWDSANTMIPPNLYNN